MRDRWEEFGPQWKAALDYLGMDPNTNAATPPTAELIARVVAKLRAIEERLDPIAPPKIDPQEVE